MNVQDALLSNILGQGQKVRQAVKHHLKRGTKYALVDFPRYPNIGDSLIWLGALRALIDQAGRRPSFTAEKWADGLEKAVDEGPVFITGGGNFGDIWTNHQDFREFLLSRFRDRPIIQLPQSIHFKTQERVGQAARLIEKHPAFHLMVRDQRSYDFAYKHFQCEVSLVPDCAFVLGPITPDYPTRRNDSVFLLRTDSEIGNFRSDDLFAQIGPRETIDWIEEPGTLIKQQRIGAILETLASGSLSPLRAREIWRKRIALARLRRGNEMLSAASKIVVTDRLHSHILCVLLGLPHIVLDNSYGKIHGYIDQWTFSSGLVHKATSVDDVVRYMKQFGAL